MRASFTTPSGISVKFTRGRAVLRVHIHASELDTPLSLRLPASGTVPRVCATTGVSRVVRVEAPGTADPPPPLTHAHGRFRR
ncbi:hypothetical protein BKA00_003124 [Actinomadura coerulea]|uniref:Uncharacterized protein n=1 Tax=Actinomadura coerulea TaxID=46159 RepID=A0A7X0KZ94_9ACTN|nr:hypothetical protein [Actinomadura coerulea]MBB6396210.1 hypothetical protein [Actinomadura coerulea]GGQ38877.1 hypothetical protein GCM10010187_65950 [Actinomadura coerulea]